MKKDESRTIAVTLRSGVAASALLLLAGIVAGLRQSPPMLLSPREVWSMGADLAAFRAEALIHAGLLLLMATPVARVVVVAWNFVRRKESAFAVISIGVLLLLIGSVIFGLWGVSK